VSAAVSTAVSVAAASLRAWMAAWDSISLSTQALARSGLSRRPGEGITVYTRLSSVVRIWWGWIPHPRS
jgi:hypothetical protein